MVETIVPQAGAGGFHELVHSRPTQGRDTISKQEGFKNYQYSFSGSDYNIICISHNDDGLSRVLTSLQTLSFSTHAELIPGRRLGERAAHGYARGIRTTAGSMIFLFMGNDPFLQEIAVSQELVKATGAYESRRCHIEMIPEFDLVIEAKNEVALYGSDGRLIIQGTKMFIGGITLAESGGTLSTHDLYTEIMYGYVARWIVPFASTIPLEDIQKLTQPKSRTAQSIGDLIEEYADTIKQYSLKMGALVR